MSIRRYRGRLYYAEDKAYLDVAEFIIRGTDIAFDLTSVSSEHGRWEAESGQPAVLQDDGTYRASRVWAFKKGVKSSGSWEIVFSIDHEAVGSLVEVSGTVAEAGDVGAFSGELHAFK